jgi:hypothetical protein
MYPTIDPGNGWKQRKMDRLASGEAIVSYSFETARWWFQPRRPLTLPEDISVNDDGDLVLRFAKYTIEIADPYGDRPWITAKPAEGQPDTPRVEIETKGYLGILASGEVNIEIDDQGRITL